MSASEVAGDVVTVIIVVMLLLTMFVLWLLLMYWLWGRVIRVRHYIKDGAPDYKYLERMEQVLFIDNVQRALDQEARERAERVP